MMMATRTNGIISKTSVRPLGGSQQRRTVRPGAMWASWQARAMVYDSSYTPEDETKKPKSDFEGLHLAASREIIMAGDGGEENAVLSFPSSKSREPVDKTLQKAQEKLSTYVNQFKDSEDPELYKRLLHYKDVWDQHVRFVEVEECGLDEEEHGSFCQSLERLVTLAQSLGMQPELLLAAAQRWEYLGEKKTNAASISDIAMQRCSDDDDHIPKSLREQRNALLTDAFKKADKEGKGWVGPETARQLLKLAGHEIHGHAAELALASLEGRALTDEDAFVTKLATGDGPDIEPRMTLSDLLFLDQTLYFDTDDSVWVSQLTKNMM